MSTGNGDLVFQTGVFTDEPPQMSSDPGPVEYSNDVDEQALVGGGQGPADPGQVLHAEPPDGAADSLPQDATDFVPGIESGTEPDAQVDALAYGLDHLYSEVVANTADLVVSFAGDEYLGGGAVSEVATLVERPSGTTLVHYTHDDLDAADSSNGAIDDVDGIELWGPLASDDAFYYSLVGDVGAGESIYVYSAGTSNPFVSHSTIVNAVMTLGYTGDANDVDLDALMVRNLASREEFEAGDEILFSIRAVPQANFDGGEIIRLPAGGAASFLSHGGHDWDSAFATAATFESTSEDVDALEATLSPFAIPSLTGRLAGVLAALLLALALVTMRRAPAADG